MRPILIVGGAPRVRVDAVRDLVAQGTGATAVALAQRLGAAGAVPDLLLSDDAVPADARRYRDRDDLERALGDWIDGHRSGVVVMSAAINDYEVATIDRRVGATWARMAPSDKLPSGADEVLIHLQPAAKVVDQLRPRWGLDGPIVAFKFEGRDTVVASAERLRTRVCAALVVANSLCGSVLALVSDRGVETVPDRLALLDRLGVAVLALAAR